MFVLALDHLEEEISALAAHLAAATARWLGLIREFDVRGGWAPGGFKSCAHWLSWRCSLSPVSAREHVRVAHRLIDLPLVAAAFERGELSYSKVRALARVEEVANEEALLTLAQVASAAQLERIVRGYRQVVAIEQGAERQYAEREVSWSWDDEGALLLRGRLPAEQGAVLVAALEAARDQLGPPPAPADSADEHDTVETVRARNADALLALADASLAAGVHSTSADRYQVVVHVDAEVLHGGAADGRCEIDDGVPLPAEAARRLACDGSIVRILERDGRPLTAGRKTRTVAPALRRALRSRDHGCVFPGCAQTRHVDAHHIHHWADGGPTDLSNLVLLCRHHHRLLHEGGFGLNRTRYGLSFTRPDGSALPQHPPRVRGDHGVICEAAPRRRFRDSATSLMPLDFNPDWHVGDAVELVLEASGVLKE